MTIRTAKRKTLLGGNFRKIEKDIHSVTCWPIILLFALFSFCDVSSTSGAIFTTVGSGNWSNTSVWSGGVVPTVGADVTVANTHTVTISANVTNSPGTLTIDPGGQLLVGGFNLSVMGTTAVNGTLTLTNSLGTHSFTGNVTIASGGVWMETAAAIITFGGNLQNDGTLTANTGGHTFIGSGKILSGANAIAISNVTVTGSYQNNGILTVATALTVTSPGVLTNNGSINANARRRFHAQSWRSIRDHRFGRFNQSQHR